MWTYSANMKFALQAVALEALALAEEMYFYDAGEKVGDPYFHL